MLHLVNLSSGSTGSVLAEIRETTESHFYKNAFIFLKIDTHTLQSLNQLKTQSLHLPCAEGEQLKKGFLLISKVHILRGVMMLKDVNI